ncbi:MAG: type IX secretion system sortase PorU [Bacteroidetes bacterium]|nr:type IX secretion system sortase PorU [Bacteroidota bacterium]
MYNKRNRLILTAILTCLYSFEVLAGEQFSVDRSLNWSETPRIFSYDDTKKMEAIQFDGASFRFENDEMLPVYAESFDIRQEGVVTITMVNAVYEVVTNGTNTGRINEKNKQQFNDEITIEHSIGFAKNKPQLDIQFVPLKKNKLTGSVEKLVSFTLVITITSNNNNNNYKTTDETDFTDHSKLSAGTWHKFSVTKEGIFKIDRSWLNANGLSGSINFSTLGIFGNGGGMLPESNATFRYDDIQENTIYKFDANGNDFLEDGDYILFYGQAPHRWNYNESTKVFSHKNNFYSDKTYYFITPDMGSGKFIENQASLPTENITSTSYDIMSFLDIDKINLINSGRNWYGDVIDAYTPERNYSFSFPDLITGEPMIIRSKAAGASPSGTIALNYTANTTVIPATCIIPLLVSGFTETYAIEAGIETTFTAPASSFNMNVKFTGSSASTAWLNYIELLGRANLKYSDAQLYFRDSRTVAPGNITKYFLDADDGIFIWDVTDRINVKNQLYVAGTDITFISSSDSLKQFIAFNTGDVFSSADINYEGEVSNQDLHDLTLTPDYVIVSHPAFLSEARRLAAYHHDVHGLDTLVVDIYQLYNEFSSGAQDISAIRDLMRMFYTRAAGDENLMPQYLLLFGDASFDYRYIMFDADKNTLKVPNYESFESLSRGISYGTDDYFGFLDLTEGDNIEETSEKLDIGIGRLPVLTLEEATQMVDKIIHYKSVESLGSWRNSLCFIADDEDYNTHVEDADLLANYLEDNYPIYNIDKIYFDSYQQIPGAGGERYPEVETAISNRMFSGAFIMNYLGHGNEQNWAQERVLGVDDINGFDNYDKLPLFITATCSFSRYDNPDRQSAGELTLLNPHGGAIALVTTVRLVYAAANYDLNSNFLEHLFLRIDGKYPALGDAVREGKNAVTTDPKNNRKFILLGDPALVLNYPKYSVKTTTVNTFPIISYTDTLKALDKVTITGQINDETGVKMTSFNGIVYPAVYDKPVTINNLVNDPTFSGVGFGPSQPFSFELQKNALYKGKASVINGEFTYTFIVPKDISYTYGNGKLSYYADNGLEDANGADFNVIIGGTADDAAEDTEGPVVDVFMNDETFVFGGLTDEDPTLLIQLNDLNGINALGNAVGHDITATLDEDQQTMLKLNDYYEAELDQYQSGTVSYPLADISEGRHSVVVKAWDVYNNSGEGYTEFVVAETADLALSHVLNYPNPFTTNTSFWFEHNRPGDILDVKVEIFTVSGKRIKTLEQQVSTDGYRVDNIEWDGLDEYGDNIGKGVYIYKLTVKASSDNSKANEFQKLVILK